MDIATAATNPATWLFPPIAWFIAVRDSVPLTAKPWHRPAASWLAPKSAEFAIRIDFVGVLRRKAPRHNHRIAEAYERNAKGAAKQRLEELRVERRPAKGRQPGTHISHHGYARGFQSHGAHHSNCRHDGQQWTRPSRQEPFTHQHHGDRQQPHGERRPVRLRRLADKLDEAGNDAVRLHWEATHLANLAKEDADGHAVEKADQYRTGEEIGKKDRAAANWL